MSLKQEPIIFNFKPNNGRPDAPALEKLPQVTLLINPETITIPWKKIITRVRTKSRIVSLYWGKEPLTLTYRGQTGNLYPNAELQKNLASSTNKDIDDSILRMADEVIILDKSIEQTEAEYRAAEVNPEFSHNLPTIQEELNSLQHARSVLLDSMAQLRQAGLEIQTQPTNDMSHTEIIKLSPKYQKFDTLRKLYEQSQTVTDLMYVKYRDWLFEGYFENFNFTDDVKSSWNWTYNLTFTILNWEELNFSSFSADVDGIIFVPDKI